MIVEELRSDLLKRVGRAKFLHKKCQVLSELLVKAKRLGKNSDNIELEIIYFNFLDILKKLENNVEFCFGFICSFIMSRKLCKEFDENLRALCKFLGSCLEDFLNVDEDLSRDRGLFESKLDESTTESQSFQAIVETMQKEIENLDNKSLDDLILSGGLDELFQKASLEVLSSTGGSLIDSSKIYLFDDKVLGISRRDRESKVVCGEFGSQITAIKKIKTSAKSSQEIDEIIKLCAFWSPVMNINVAQLFGMSLLDEDNLCFVMRRYDQNLKTLLYTKKQKLSPQQNESIMHGVVKGLSFLHNNRVLHKDLRPESILLSSNLETVVLTNFGTCPASNSELDCYQAPEVLKMGGYSTKSDMYSYGVVCWELYHVESPSKKDDLSFSDDLPVKGWIIKIVDACRHKNPNNRPLATDVVSKFLKPSQQIIRKKSKAGSNRRKSSQVVSSIFSIFTSSPTNTTAKGGKNSLEKQERRKSSISKIRKSGISSRKHVSLREEPINVPQQPSSSPDNIYGAGGILSIDSIPLFMEQLKRESSFEGTMEQFSIELSQHQNDDGRLDKWFKQSAKAGILATILLGMGANLDEFSTQILTLRTITLMVEKGFTDYTSNGLVEEILKTMEMHKDNNMVQYEGIRVLLVCFQKSPTSSSFLPDKTPILNTIYKVLDHHPFDLQIQREGLALLNHFGKECTITNSQLLGILSNHRDDIQVEREGLGILCNTNQYDSSCLDVCNSIMESMEMYGSDLKIQKLCLKILYNLVSLVDLQSFDSKILIFKAMKSFPEEQVLQEFACIILLSLGFETEQEQSEFLQAGVEEHVLNMFTKYPENVDLHQQLFLFLSLLGGNGELPKSAELTDAVLKLLNMHETRAKFVEMGFECLKWILRMDTIGDSEFISFILEILKKHKKDGKVHTSGFDLLTKYCDLDLENIQKMLHQNVTRVLFRSMQTHIQEPKVLEAGLGLLCAVSKSDSARDHLMKAGTGHHILQSMQKHKNDPCLQRAGCDALTMLSWNAPHNAEALVNPGYAHSTIYEIMKMHKDDPNLQASCCKSLASISFSPKSRYAIFRTQGVEVVLASMKHHLSNPLVIQAGCNALTMISQTFDLKKPLVHSLMVGEFLQTVFKTHRKNASVLSHACETVYSLSLERENKVELCKYLSKSMIKIIKHHQDAMLLENTCEFILSLCTEVANRKVLLTTHNAHLELLEMMNNNLQNLYLIRIGFCAITKLTEDPSSKKLRADLKFKGILLILEDTLEEFSGDEMLLNFENIWN